MCTFVERNKTHSLRYRVPEDEDVLKMCLVFLTLMFADVSRVNT